GKLNVHNKIQDILKYAKEANFELVSYEDITESVLAGTEHTAKRYDRMMDQMPWYIRIFKAFVRYFYFAPNSEAYDFLKNGDIIYPAACWKKPEAKNELN
uniref:Uncharacterized protein n=1 Tax=Acrobeloides nanus TaxID=290746 RepID=A0A914DBP1_9BILA